MAEEIPIGRLLAQLADEDAARPAVTCGEQSLSRRELDEASTRLAWRYRDLGVAAGRMVTIALPNGVDYVVHCAAAWKVGAVPQPLSHRLPVHERRSIVELADAALVVGVEPDDHPGRCVLSAHEPGASGGAERPLPDAVSPSWKAPASGGSTGRPKLVVDSRPGSIDPSSEPPYGIQRNGVVLVPGPLYHNAPFTCAFGGLFVGAHVVLLDRFDAMATLEAIGRNGVDFVLLVPTMMHRIWQLPAEARARFDLRSLRRVWHMGAPCPAWLKERWLGWIGPERIFELYGGTERQAYTVVDGHEWLERRGSVGRPAYGEIRVVTEDGTVAPAGQRGIVQLRAPARDRPTYRYVGAPSGEEADGWDTLGDVGWMDAAGYLYLDDRRTDLILTGGANVYPAEVEGAIEAYAGVRSAVVVGLPDDDLGQRVHAIVEADHVDEVGLRRFVESRLVRYKVPRSFEFVEHALRDDAGKTRRFALRDERISDPEES